MMRTTLFSLTVLAGSLLLQVHHATGQTASEAQAITQKELRVADAIRAYDGTNNDFTKLDLRDLRTKGSPYLLRGWVKTDIQLLNRTVKDVPAKYDAFQQELRIRRPQGDSIIIEPSTLVQFTMTDATINGERKRVFRRYPQLKDQALAQRYLEVLHETNDVHLLKLTRKVLTKGNTSVSYNGTQPNDRFEEKVSYYAWNMRNNSLQQVKLTAKSLGQARPEWEQVLKGKEQLSEEDLLAAIRQAH